MLWHRWDTLDYHGMHFASWSCEFSRDCAAATACRQRVPFMRDVYYAQDEVQHLRKAVADGLLDLEKERSAAAATARDAAGNLEVTDTPCVPCVVRMKAWGLTIPLGRIGSCHKCVALRRRTPISRCACVLCITFPILCNARTKSSSARTARWFTEGLPEGSA